MKPLKIELGTFLMIISKVEPKSPSLVKTSGLTSDPELLLISIKDSPGLFGTVKLVFTYEYVSYLTVNSFTRY